MARGLLLVYSGIKPSTSLSLASYHAWYNQHLRDVLALRDADAGAATAALRYKLLSAASDARLQRHPFLALYPLADAEHVRTRAFEQRPMEGAFESIDFDARVYEEIQRFAPGTGERAGGRRGDVVVLVGMTPGGGEEGERDFDEWYRKQHLDMLSMCRGYLRTTRYRVLEPHTASLHAADDFDVQAVPKFLAVHDYASSDLPADQIKQTTSTEWSRSIISKCKRFDRDVGEIIHEEVRDGEGVASL